MPHPGPVIQISPDFLKPTFNFFVFLFFPLPTCFICFFFLFFISTHFHLCLLWTGLLGGSGSVPEKWGLFPSSSSFFSSSSTYSSLCFSSTALLQSEGDPSAASDVNNCTCSCLVFICFCFVVIVPFIITN